MTSITTSPLSPINLSNDGPALSPIVAGAWRMTEWGLTVKQRVRWIEQCMDLGITSFDHADIYGDYTVEALFGEALSAQPALRKRMQIITKCGIKLRSSRRPEHTVKSYDTSAAHVMDSVDRSLRSLKTDHIDLLLIHRPDVLMDPDELASTLSHLRTVGKVSHFGVSNHSPAQLALLHRRIPLVTNQIELSPLQLQALSDGTLEQCLDLKLRPMIWSPMAGGRLFKATDARSQRVRTVLEELGKQRGVSTSTMAYAWILRHPSHPIPITGSQRAEGLRDAVAALSIQIPTQDWYRVLESNTGQPVP